jgi:hypothetical protein
MVTWPPPLPYYFQFFALSPFNNTSRTGSCARPTVARATNRSRVTMYKSCDMWHDIWHVACDGTFNVWHMTCGMTYDMWHDIWHVAWHMTCGMTYDMWHDIWHVACDVTFNVWHVTFDVTCELWHLIIFRISLATLVVRHPAWPRDVIASRIKPSLFRYLKPIDPQDKFSCSDFGHVSTQKQQI